MIAMEYKIDLSYWNRMLDKWASENKIDPSIVPRFKLDNERIWHNIAAEVYKDLWRSKKFVIPDGVPLEEG